MDMSGENMGMNIANMCTAMGIPANRVGYVHQDKFWLNEYSASHLSCLYSCMDVLANPALGEGFGVPIIEAQACGTPVSVTDWTSMPELVGSGWAVQGEPFYRPPSAAWWSNPYIGGLVEALGMARDKKDDAEFRAQARNFALQYDADLVTQEYWKPTLEALEAPREVKPLLPNRSMRRAQKKAKA
jgi:glycosyltransferase involved in cell wall biosynthesis